MSDNHSTNGILSQDTLTIMGTKVPTTTQMLQQRSLKFFPDNPRVYSIVRANGKQPSQEEIQEQLCDMEHVKELRLDILRNGGLLEALIVKAGYRLTRPSRFIGVPTSYGTRTGTADASDAARRDPFGFYHGMVVKRGSEAFVMSGPPLRFIAETTPSRPTPDEPEPMQLTLF